MTFENMGGDEFPEGFGDIPDDANTPEGQEPLYDGSETDDVSFVSGMSSDAERVDPPSVREPEDTPDFDVVQFEAEAIERAAEFDGQVTRLARFRTHEDLRHPWVRSKEAHYDLPDGMRVKMLHETYDGDRSKIAAFIEITQPPVEMMCADGQIRRVTLSRSIIHRSFREGHEEVIDTYKATAESDPLLRDDINRLQAAVGRAKENRAAASFDPDYRPPELIWACTNVLVECKLRNGPNYRTELYLPSMAADTRTAHETARRHAGERVDKPEYDIAEHRAVMALLSDIDPKLIKPTRLERDFHFNWAPPAAPENAWMP